MLKSIIYKLHLNSYFIKYVWITKELQRFEKRVKDKSQTTLLGGNESCVLLRKLKNYLS